MIPGLRKRKILFVHFVNPFRQVYFPFGFNRKSFPLPRFLHSRFAKNLKPYRPPIAHKNAPLPLRAKVRFRVRTTGSTGGLHDTYKELLPSGPLKRAPNLYYRITRTVTRKRIRLCFCNFCDNSEPCFRQTGLHKAQKMIAAPLLSTAPLVEAVGILNTQLPSRVAVWLLSAVCLNMDNQSKKTNPNSSVVTKRFGFACSGNS